MENITKTIERLVQFSDYSGISLNKIAVEIGVSNSYFSKMVRNKANMGSDIIEKILRTYKEINPDWFLLGVGGMIRNKKQSIDILEEPITQYKGSRCEKCKLKDELIESLRNQVTTQGEFIKCLQEIKSSVEDGQKRKAS